MAHNGHSLPIVRQIPVKNKKSFALFWQGGVMLSIFKTNKKGWRVLAF
jgi:hypothetical protein